MTRLYYDCPIEAAYMAKNFGVNILTSKDSDGTCWELCGLYDLIKNSYKEQIKPLYIHPDSEHIFEPKKNDIITCWRASFELESPYIFESKDEEYLYFNYGCQSLIKNFKDIIKRDNKAFIMSKKEKEDAK